MSASPRLLAHAPEGHDVVPMRRHSPILHAGLAEARRLIAELGDRARERGDRVDEEDLGALSMYLPRYIA